MASSRSSSPVPPPMSPITPTLPPAHLASNPPAVEPLPPATTAQSQSQPSSSRPTYAHSQQPDQVGVPPPPPQPIEFDTNPDVIALRSAITVLQIQKNRATADIQTLSQIKNAAIERPDEFVRDLVQGKIGQGAAQAQYSSSSSAAAGADSDAHDRVEPAWIAHSIPKAQDVVRCPPINWSQYAVVGEPLDKLHNEQLSRPTQGTPATLGAGGVYQFTGGDGKQEEYPGVAAPYAPLKDKIEKKTKSRK